MAQLGAAIVNALGKHAPRAGMRDVEILLHHRAGAADLVTNQAACLRQQQVVDRALNAIAFRLIAGRELRSKRGQRRAIAAGSSDGLCSRKNFVHHRRPSCCKGQR